MEIILLNVLVELEEDTLLNGLKFLKLVGSRSGFLIRGVTCPNLSGPGMEPDEREELIIFVQEGMKRYKAAFGRGSAACDAGLSLAMILDTSSSVTGVNSNRGVSVIDMCCNHGFGSRVWLQGLVEDYFQEVWRRWRERTCGNLWRKAGRR